MKTDTFSYKVFNLPSNRNQSAGGYQEEDGHANSSAVYGKHIHGAFIDARDGLAISLMAIQMWHVSLVIFAVLFGVDLNVKITRQMQQNDTILRYM